MSRVQEAAKIVVEAAEELFAAASTGVPATPKDWAELRQKEFWKPFRAKMLNTICTRLHLSRQNSTATAYLNAAAKRASGGIRKRVKGGGRKHKVIIAPPTARQTAAAIHMISKVKAASPNPTNTPFGRAAI
ncbi:MAG: hypothetical protein DDT26_01944 [Dehalococcoidia bacterium]|nr:hypothetical protein [Chloroflexota bacterium]